MLLPDDSGRVQSGTEAFFIARIIDESGLDAFSWSDGGDGGYYSSSRACKEVA